MKHLILKRIILLMTIAIIGTSVLISGLGFLLSEDLILDMRTYEYKLDLSILTQVTSRYIEGEIDLKTYEAIVKAPDESGVIRYVIYDSLHTQLTGETPFSDLVDQEIQNNLEKVLRGNEEIVRVHDGNMEFELVGVPIMDGTVCRGAVFVEMAQFDLTDMKSRFFKSLFMSMFFVIIFVIGISYIVLSRIISPVRNVVSTALAITEGDFSKRADETLKGEIGLISRTMNKLMVELYKNVSQLYIEKNRLNHVLNSLEEGMIAVDQDKTITHQNQVFLKMFSVDLKDIDGLMARGTPAIQLIHRGLDQVLMDGSPFNEMLHFSDAIYRVIIEPIENESGQIVGAVVLFRDVTEMENLEGMRKNYVANVSHELRSPLTSIQGLIEPLMDDIVTDTADVKRYYEIIYRESLRLSRLVNDIMELSRLQSSDSHIVKRQFDLDHVIQMVHERFKTRREDLNFLYERKDLPKVLSNTDRVEQILVILLDNAYKFTKEGGTIEIDTEIIGRKIWVSVRDTGVGISSEHMPFVFNRFYKSDQSRTHKSTGLGLSIAREIMTIMEEEITCSSDLGIGSTFKFSVEIA